jgi:drug/metabolite transporter (DMT)-like permease
MTSNAHPPNRWLAYGYLALAMALAGAYVALSKTLVAALPVLLLAWLRFGIAGIAMANWLKKPPGELPMTRNTKWLLFLESFLGNFMFSICMLYGVSMTSAVSAGVIMAAIPAVVAVMSWAFLKETIGLRVWAAVACGALGIALLALTRYSPASTAANAADTSRMLWGNLLLVCAVLCDAFYAVIGKKLTGAVSPKRIAAIINLCGFLLMTPMGIYTALDFDFAVVQGSSWLLLVFYALAASVWTVWLWMTGSKSVPGAHAGVFTVLLPIAAALVGVSVLGEQLTTMQVLAFGIALVGVLLATLPGRPSATPIEPHL